MCGRAKHTNGPAHDSRLGRAALLSLLADHVVKHQLQVSKRNLSCCELIDHVANLLPRRVDEEFRLYLPHPFGGCWVRPRDNLLLAIHHFA